MSNAYKTEWNCDSFAVICTEINGKPVGEILVFNGNLWDTEAERLAESGSDLDAWAMVQADEQIKAFEATGLTLWQRYNDNLRETWDTTTQDGRVVANWPNEAAARKASEKPHPWHGKLLAVKRAESQPPEVPHF